MELRYRSVRESLNAYGAKSAIFCETYLFEVAAVQERRVSYLLEAIGNAYFLYSRSSETQVS